MSYGLGHLGQAKLLPGQINFMTTRTGRLPSLQPLIEAGLPIAPYIEHGSYEMGLPAIMRYGRDPYRGLMGLPSPRVRRSGRLGKERPMHLVIYGDNWARTSHGGGIHVKTMGEAMRRARGVLSLPGNQGDTLRIYRASDGPRFDRRRALRSLANRPRRRQAQPAMGQILTDWACDQTAFAASWRQRLNGALDGAALATVVGAGAAGVLGALIGRPILGAAAGGAVGLAAHAIWTAPLRV